MAQCKNPVVILNEVKNLCRIDRKPASLQLAFDIEP